MIELEPAISLEYDRVLQQIDGLPHIEDSIAIDIRDVVKAHFLIANRFYMEQSGLGGVGPKDIGLLESAVHRQVISFGGNRKWHGVFEICATLLFGLIKNHPFHDANKRTAILSAIFLLFKSRYCPSVDERVIEDFTVEIADDKLTKYSRFNDIVKKGQSDPEVHYIAYFLRSNTRRIDNISYTITFCELQAILNRYGFVMENPDNNYIDIVKYEERPSLIPFIGKPRTVARRLLQIGFPRWTAEVPKGVIKRVREVTKLSHADGVDSASFFHGVDAMQSLITTYHNLLMRLADR